MHAGWKSYTRACSVRHAAPLSVIHTRPIKIDRTICGARHRNILQRGDISGTKICLFHAEKNIVQRESNPRVHIIILSRPGKNAGQNHYGNLIFTYIYLIQRPKFLYISLCIDTYISKENIIGLKF